MQELIFFVEKSGADPHPIFEFRPSFGSPLKMCNLFMNRCVIDEDSGFEIQDINYMDDFSDRTDSEKLLLQAYLTKFLWKRRPQGMCKIDIDKNDLPVLMYHDVLLLIALQRYH